MSEAAVNVGTKKKLRADGQKEAAAKVPTLAVFAKVMSVRQRDCKHTAFVEFDRAFWSVAHISSRDFLNNGR
jgi:hypothetical protein